MLTHGSFCTGYGGLDMAVEHFYDAETVWHSEIDKHCSQLLEKHGYANNLGDLTEINWEDVEPVDIMSAGFPCQPFSHAGNRKGNNDERAIFQWIADGISVLRPGVVVLENVAGILTLGGTSVIGALAEIGYDAKWGLVRASEVGTCHRRERWFCIAENSSGVGTNKRETGTICEKGNSERPRGKVRFNGSNSAFVPNTSSKIAFDSTSDRRSLRQTGKIHKSKSRPVNGSNRVPVPNTAGVGFQELRPERGLGETETETRRLSSFGAYEPAVRRWEETLGRTAPVPVDERGINNSFVEWMMGLPENHVCNQGLSRTAELKMLGNGVVPQQALLALVLLNE